MGFTIVNPYEGRVRTLILLDGVDLEIKLHERSKRFEVIPTEKQKRDPWSYNKYRFEPTGEFEVTLSRWPLNQRHWKDRDNLRLEDRLNEIVWEIVYSAELVRLEDERREAERLRQLELERLAEERRRRAQEEKERRDELEQQAQLWSKSRTLMEYLRTCELMFSERGLLKDPQNASVVWLNWGYEHVTRIDPTQNGSMKKLIDEVGSLNDHPSDAN